MNVSQSIGSPLCQAWAEIVETCGIWAAALRLGREIEAIPPVAQRDLARSSMARRSTGNARPDQHLVSARRQDSCQHPEHTARFDMASTTAESSPSAEELGAAEYTREAISFMDPLPRGEVAAENTREVIAFIERCPGPG